MIISYRVAVESDRDSVSELLAQLGYQVTPAQVSQRLQAIRQRQGEVMVACKGDRVVGCINAIRDLRLAAGEVGELVSLVVEQGHRGEGIGRGLISEAVQWLADNHCEKVRVRANTIREQAHRFYTEMGFNEVKCQKIFVLNISRDD
ncbi:GNAT family N-acetyltransferase [Marinobacterium jannaschii]|uniref:GNAT family N-acetyltransferase n=1 Tax=Marinobacterium jannaschii TaxID=64970 RepID=UPI0004853248|nr:GNAT family N-acetyltransferase [Marinobacterium jannaschii]